MPDSEECDELEELWITVLKDKRSIVLTDDGQKRVITTRVVEERETADGELVEISRNFFATCRSSNDIRTGARVDQALLPACGPDCGRRPGVAGGFRAAQGLADVTLM